MMLLSPVFSAAFQDTFAGSGDLAFWPAGLLGISTLLWVQKLSGRAPARSAGGWRPKTPTERWMVRAAGAAGLTCTLIGLLVLCGGWALDIALFRTALPGYNHMKANTAFCFAAAGCALWILAQPAPNRLLANTLASMVIWCGSLTFIEHAVGMDLGIDELLFRDLTGAGVPGRMALVTAELFVLAGFSLLLSHRQRWVPTVQALACTTGIFCLLSLIGHLYGERHLFGRHVNTAIHASFGFVILSAGVLLLQPQAGIMATISSAGPGGLMARRLLPAAILGPALLGWLRWQGQLLGLYGTAFGLALFASSSMVVFVLLIWMNAARLNHAEKERRLAEGKRAESEKRYRIVLESLPQMVWTCLPDGQCDFVSRQWVDYTGIPEKDQLGFGWANQVHPEDREEVRIRWQAALTRTANFEAEYRVRSASGEYRWFRAVGVPLIDSAGEKTKWFGTSTDVQALKATEEALRESEATFRQLADAMPQIVWTAKPDGYLEYYNQRWYDFTGMSLEETKAWGWQPVLHPEDLARTLARWRHSLDSGEQLEIEYRFRRASDGVYRWHLGRAEAIRNASGEIVRWYGTCTDIEDYKRSEGAVKNLNEALEERVRQRTAELWESEERLRSSIDDIPDYAFLMLDPQGRILTWNPGAERIKGYTASEIIGQHFSRFYPEEERVKGYPLQLLERAKAEGQTRAEGWRMRRDGTSFWAEVAIKSVYSNSGDLIGFCKVTRDNTERRQVEQQLIAERARAEEANRAKSEFLASMSHEIRTPMNSILGMADVLWDTELSAEQRQYVEVFRRAGANLLTLINDILDISKIEAGHLELEQVEFDLESVIDESLELVGQKARSKGLNLLFRLMPGLTTSLIGDPTRVRQVLINLLGNAIKFTDSGEVILTVGNSELSPGSIEFTVADTGVGIPAEKLETIFHEFTQADTSTTRRFGGTGLGLAISRRIVEQMGGKLTVTSALGVGSTFKFTMTFKPGPSGARSSRADVHDLQGKRILIIDDNATHRLILRETLGVWGVESDECATPSGASAALSGSSYGLVLIDNRMPAMNGFELAAQIRRDSYTVPIVMLTSDTRPGDQARRQQLNLAGYATKPVSRSELLRLLCTAVRAGNNPESQVAPVPAPCIDSRAQSISLRILVADDSPDNRMLIAAYMKDTLHSLTYVEDGQAAIEAFGEGGRFDLILMDVQMPRVDGLTATRTIRAVEQECGLKPTPILALTANAQAHDVHLSHEAGCSAHLSKPLSKQKLLDALEEYGQPDSARTHGPEPIHITIPAGLEQLVPEYLAQRKCEVSSMLSLLALSDHDRLRVLGYNMKSTGASYGLPQLTVFGEEVESAAMREDYAALSRQIAQLDAYLSRVHLVTA